MATVTALLETIGVASIVPFMMVVANPKVLHEQGWLGDLYAYSGMQSDNRFLVLLGLAVFAVMLVSNVVKALTTWFTQRFTYRVGHNISLELYRSYLDRPYEYFLSRHTSDLGKNVLSEVDQVLVGVIQPGVVAISRTFVATLICLLLLITNPLLALVVVVVLGGAYALLYTAIRTHLSRIGTDRVAANRERYHVASESFSGIKEVKLKSLEDAYGRRFLSPSERYAVHQAASQSIAALPRYGMEVIAFGGILTIVIYLLAVEKGVQHALPLIALYAFAGYRIMPTLQEIFASVARIRFSMPALDVLYKDIQNIAPPERRERHPAPLPFTSSIRMDRVTFSYPSSVKPVLRDISIEIRRGTRVGFVGPTGSGKSTAVDLILGLLRPTEGQVLVDGEPLASSETIRRWQSLVGYVPQHIFLADDTVAANIAFGEELDGEKVEKAARMAQLHDFIVAELPQGYDTRIGERGIRLSGGQRQRLGLARALYGNPSVLVLDEATSALDTATEDAVMSALDGLDSGCTIIIIAHRLSTIRKCDVNFKFENGALIGTVSSEELLDPVSLPSNI
jgi:ABC-type bacteriocin/lantibiotic exporter with double-glycine peptidase domain